MTSLARFVAPRFCTGLAALSLVLVNSCTTAQDRDSSPALLGDGEREAVVLRISQLLEQEYVYPEVGEESGADLIDRLQAGEFDGISSHAAFAAHLTAALQRVSHDKHLRVLVRTSQRAPAEPEDPGFAVARQNHGFEKVERLEGNVGYVDMRYFDGNPAAKPTAAAAMNSLADADAIIDVV